MKRFWSRARLIAKRDGITGLAKRGYSYFTPRIFRYEHVFLYKNPTRIQMDSSLFQPKRSDVVCKIITSNKEAELTAGDYTDIREIMFDAENILDKGGTAVCLFIGRNLVHISWLGLNQKSRAVIDNIPYEIDFSQKSACTGKTFTDPEYRGQNLMVYGNFKKLEYLRENGIDFLYHTVGVDNIPSQKGYGKFKPVIYAELRYFYLLGIKYLKEKKLIEN